MMTGRYWTRAYTDRRYAIVGPGKGAVYYLTTSSPASTKLSTTLFAGGRPLFRIMYLWVTVNMKRQNVNANDAIWTLVTEWPNLVYMSSE